jgi:lysophospholipase L1-like esterase
VTRIQGDPKTTARWRRLPDPAYGEAKQIALDTYTRNVEAVIEQAGELGIEVVLVTVVSNTHEYPRRRANWASVKKKDHGFPGHMGAWLEHYRAGIDHFEAGRFHDALQSFKTARDHSMGGRAPTQLNERVRALADAHAHVHLVDFERVLDRVGVEEGLGCNFFGTETWCDQFHPNPRTQKMIARHTVEKIESLGR